MKILNSLLVPAALVASFTAFAQPPASVPPPAQHTAAPAAAASSSGAAKQPDRADAYYHFELGHMYEEMVTSTGRTEFVAKAVEEYKAALQADPTSTYLATALAEVYARTGDVRGAIAAAQDIISHDPDNLEARRLLGQIYLRSIGDLQGGTQSDTEAILHLAIEQYEQIVRLDPTSIEDHLLLGRLYRLNNQTSKAEAEFRTSVQLQPSSEDAVTTLALLYKRKATPAAPWKFCNLCRRRTARHGLIRCSATPTNRRRITNTPSRHSQGGRSRQRQPGRRAWTGSEPPQR